jgi:hypothetical protein
MAQLVKGSFMGRNVFTPPHASPKRELYKDIHNFLESPFEYIMFLLGIHEIMNTIKKL